MSLLTPIIELLEGDQWKEAKQETAEVGEK
jgi:hypothetical protein